MENPSLEIHDCDWEIIPNSDEDHHSSTNSSGVGGLICSDYFSLDFEHNYTATDNAVVDTDIGGGDESDDPNWVDPSSVTVISGGNRSGRRKRSRSFNSSSPSSDSNSSGCNLMYSIQHHSECCGVGFECQNQGFSGFDHLGFSDHFPKSPENDAGISSVVEVDDKVKDNSEQKQEEHEVNDQISSSNFEVEEKKNEGNENEDEDEEKRVVWWKVPLEVLKYCVMRVSPVWSLSMAAAALMGFVLLRRRHLYKMKRKSLGIQLNVTVDDKKVSQFMSRAALLNEAFSVVKRVPIIRPALPAPGLAPWPVMSLR